MRRILYILSVAAALLLSASCSKMSSGKVTMESVAGTYDLVDVLLYYDDTEVYFDYETDYVYYVTEPDGGTNWGAWSPMEASMYAGITFNENGKIYLLGTFDLGITWRINDGKVLLTYTSSGESSEIKWSDSGELMAPHCEIDQAYAYVITDKQFYNPPREDWKGNDGKPHHLEAFVVLKKR